MATIRDIADYVANEFGCFVEVDDESDAEALPCPEPHPTVVVLKTRNINWPTNIETIEVEEEDDA